MITNINITRIKNWIASLTFEPKSKMVSGSYLSYKWKLDVIRDFGFSHVRFFMFDFVTPTGDNIHLECLGKVDEAPENVAKRQIDYIIINYEEDVDIDDYQN